MSRAAFQVLVIPYRIDANGQPLYLLFKRSDQNVWQWIAGGGETDEQPEQTARRESFEEAGIPENGYLIRLDSLASIPAIHFADHHLWGTDVYVIPEYSLVLKLKQKKFVCPANTKNVFGWTTKQHIIVLNGTAIKPLCESCKVVCY